MSNHGIAQDPAQSRTQTSAFAPRISGPLPGPKARAIVEADDRWISPSYTRSYPLVAKRGRGVRIEDADGNEFLDFAAGIAVTSTGHCHPEVVKAIQQQAGELIHMSGTDFYYEGMVTLAERLSAVAPMPGPHRFYYGNSGAEAVECAIKMARKYHAASGKPDRFRIITFEGAFHGRTLATIAAGGQQKYLEGFGPPVEGFDQVPFGDLDAVKKAIGPQTAAIIIEPVQGEGGVRPVPLQFLKALRELCDQHGMLLIFDEVQCGMGRTGELFAYKRTGVTPDIMPLAKALGGGFPIGACLATTEAAKGMVPGTHGSTFGGNPLAMAAGNAVLDVMLAPGFLEHVQRISLLLKQKLAGICDRYPDIASEVRGEGLLTGIKAVIPAGDLSNALRAEKLLTVAAGENVVRMLPPLIVNEAEIEDAVQRIERACAKLSNAAKRGAA